MKVDCPHCPAKYDLPDSDADQREIKCRKCGSSFAVARVRRAPPPRKPAKSASAPTNKSARPRLPAPPPPLRLGSLSRRNSSKPAQLPVALLTEPEGKTETSTNSSSSWLVKVNGKEERTMSGAEIIAWWSLDQLTPDSQVWREGLDAWVPILGDPKLAELLTGGDEPTVVATSAIAQMAKSYASSPCKSSPRQEAPEEVTVQAALDYHHALFDDPAAKPKDDDNSTLFSLESLEQKYAESERPDARQSDASSLLMDSAAMPMAGRLTVPDLTSFDPTATPPPPASVADANTTKVGASRRSTPWVAAALGSAVLCVVAGVWLSRSHGEPEQELRATVAIYDESGPSPRQAALTRPAEKGAAREPASEAKKAVAAPEAQPSAEVAKSPAETAPTETEKPTPTASEASPTQPIAPVWKPKPKSKPKFSTSAARSALASAAANASGCKQAGGPVGRGKVQVTFANSGRVTSAQIIAGPFAGNTVGGCVARAFRGARVPSFDGDPVTVQKSFALR